MSRFLKYIAEAQEISSAGTSLKQVAALFKKVSWKEGTINFDIGGGKYDLGTEYLASRGVTNLIFDPYNRSKQHNDEVLKRVTQDRPDTITVNNVLNVIKEPEARDDVIRMAAHYIGPGGIVYFSIYEGRKDGNAGVSKMKDGQATQWQNHLPASAYVDEIKKYFSSVTLRNGIITARK